MLYTDFSNARAITWVMLIPLQSVFPLGTSTLGRGVMRALSYDEGQVLNPRDKFQILHIKRVKISAWSLHTQTVWGPVQWRFSSGAANSSITNQNNHKILERARLSPVLFEQQEDNVRVMLVIGQCHRIVDTSCLCQWTVPALLLCILPSYLLLSFMKTYHLFDFSNFVIVEPD